MPRYYKQLVPQNGVPLSNNTKVMFTTLNGLVGYFATADAFIIGEFERCMREQRSGISEISLEEFTRDYLDEKKNQSSPSQQPWREEISKAGHRHNGPIAALGGEAVRAVVGVKTLCDNRAKPCGLSMEEGSTAVSTAPVAAAVEAVAPAASEVKQEFKPRIGKRTQRKVGNENRSAVKG